MQIHFDHIHVFSRNPEELGKWFETFFDATVQPLETLTKIVIGSNDCPIFVHKVAGDEAPAQPSVGFNHLGFGVKNIDKVYETFKSKGATFTKDIATPREGLRMFFVSGPDNVVVEILERDARFKP